MFSLKRIPEYSRSKSEDICPTAKTWSKLGHESGQWFEAHQQNNKPIQEKKKRMKVLEWPSQCQDPGSTEGWCGTLSCV